MISALFLTEKVAPHLNSQTSYSLSVNLKMAVRKEW
jgi:hypothetical protein